jgi:hypothetical protein
VLRTRLSQSCPISPGTAETSTSSAASGERITSETTKAETVTRD